MVVIKVMFKVELASYRIKATRSFRVVKPCETRLECADGSYYFFFPILCTRLLTHACKQYLDIRSYYVYIIRVVLETVYYSGTDGPNLATSEKKYDQCRNFSNKPRSVSRKRLKTCPAKM